MAALGHRRASLADCLRDPGVSRGARLLCQIELRTTLLIGLTADVGANALHAQFTVRALGVGLAGHLALLELTARRGAAHRESVVEYGDALPIRSAPDLDALAALGIAGVEQRTLLIRLAGRLADSGLAGLPVVAVPVSCALHALAAGTRPAQPETIRVFRTGGRIDAAAVLALVGAGTQRSVVANVGRRIVQVRRGVGADGSPICAVWIGRVAAIRRRRAIDLVTIPGSLSA